MNVLTAGMDWPRKGAECAKAIQLIRSRSTSAGRIGPVPFAPLALFRGYPDFLVSTFRGHRSSNQTRQAMPVDRHDCHSPARWCHNGEGRNQERNHRWTQMDTDTDPVLSVSICVHLWLPFSKIPTKCPTNRARQCRLIITIAFARHRPGMPAFAFSEIIERQRFNVICQAALESESQR